MAVNLFDMFKDAAGDMLIKNAGSLLGGSSDQAGSALGSIIPSLMGGLIQKGGTDAGAKGLLDFINTGGHDGGILDNIGDLLGGGDSGGGMLDKLLGSGGGVLKYLVGDKLGSLVDLVSGSSGMNTGGVGKLLKMAAPLLIGVLGKHIKGSGLGIGALKDLLLGHRKQVADLAPAGISDLLGFSGLSNLGGDIKEAGSRAADAAAATASTVASTGKSGLSKALPWVVLLAAALGLLYFVGRGCNASDVTDAATKTMDKAAETAKKGVTAATDAAKEGAAAVGDAAKAGAARVAGALKSISLPGGVKIDAPEGSFTEKLASALGKGNVNANQAFTFDGVNFQTGSASLTGESSSQLDNLAAVMKAYAKSTIRVEGHTDNTGDAAANKRLSNQRALSVKQYLQSKGIASNRIEALGRGQDKPIAANSTDEGKAKNRRVEVFVTGS